MISEKLNELILKSMKEGNKIKLNTIRMIKTKFMEFSTAKNATELTYDIEVKLIQNMVKQRIDSAEQYKNSNRIDLMENELEEIKILKEFLPIDITTEQIMEVINKSNLELDKKNMGNLIKEIKEVYPTVDGKLASNIVRSILT